MMILSDLSILSKRSVLIALVLGMLLCSCSHKADLDLSDESSDQPSAQPHDHPKKSAEELYEEAAQLMYAKRFKQAAKKFEKLQEQYPYATWSLQARLMGGYCLYQAHKYEDAIDEFLVFTQLHPFHKETPYAFYMIALSYYERISIVDRDQKDSEQALQYFQKVIDTAPYSSYAKDAHFKMDFIRNHLAVKEMQVGRFYQQENSILAAINRFKKVVQNFETTEQCPEALFRLIECYTVLNMKEEIQQVLAVLKLNHPESIWTKRVDSIKQEIVPEKKRKHQSVKKMKEETVKEIKEMKKRLERKEMEGEEEKRAVEEMVKMQKSEVARTGKPIDTNLKSGKEEETPLQYDWMVQ